MYPQGSTPQNSNQPRLLQFSIDLNNQQFRNLASQFNKQSVIASPQTPTANVSCINSVRFIQATTPRQPPNILFNSQNKLFLDSNKISFLNANSNQFVIQQNQKNVQILNEFTPIHQNHISIDHSQKLGCQNINNPNQVQNNAQRQQVTVPVICQNNNANISDKIKDFLKYFVVKSSTNNNNEILFEMVQSSSDKNGSQSTLPNSPSIDQTKQAQVDKLAQNQLFQNRIQQQLEKLKKNSQEPLLHQQHLPKDKPPKRVYRKRVVADKISNNGQEPKRRRQTKKIQEDNQIQNALNKDLFQIIVKNNKLYNNDINANNSSTNIEETSNISLDKKTPSSTSFTDNADNVMYCMVPQQSYTIYLPDGSKHHTPIIFPDDLPGLSKSQKLQSGSNNHIVAETSSQKSSATVPKSPLLATSNKFQQNHVNTLSENNQVNNQPVSGTLVGNHQIQKTAIIKQEVTDPSVFTTSKQQCTTPQNKVTFMDINSDSSQKATCNNTLTSSTIHTPLTSSTKLLHKKSVTMPLLTTPHHNSHSADVVQILISDEEEEDGAMKNDLMNKSFESAIQNNQVNKTTNDTSECLLSQWPIIKEEKILFNLHLKQLLFYGSNIHASNYCTFTLNHILFYKHKRQQNNPDDRNTHELSAKNFVFHLPLRSINELRLHHGLCGPLIFLKTNLTPLLVQLFKIHDVFVFHQNEDQGDLQYLVLIPDKENLLDHSLIPHYITTSSAQNTMSANDASDPLSLPSTQVLDTFSNFAIQQNPLSTNSSSIGDNDVKNTMTVLTNEKNGNSDANNINEDSTQCKEETKLDIKIEQVSTQCWENSRSAEVSNLPIPTTSINSTFNVETEACMNTSLISTQATSPLFPPTVTISGPSLVSSNTSTISVSFNGSHADALKSSVSISSMQQTNCVETFTSAPLNTTMKPNVFLSLSSLASIAFIKSGLNVNTITDTNDTNAKNNDTTFINISSNNINTDSNNKDTIAKMDNSITDTTTIFSVSTNNNNTLSYEASSVTFSSVDNVTLKDTTNISLIPTTSFLSLNLIPTSLPPIPSTTQSMPTITKQPITSTRSETITTSSAGSTNTTSLSLNTTVTTTSSVAQKPLITSQPLISKFFCEMINEVWLQAGVKVDFSEVKGDWAKEKVESIAKVSDKQKQNQTPVQEKQSQPNKQTLQLKPPPIILSNQQQQQQFVLQLAQQQQQQQLMVIQQQQLNTPQTFVKSMPQQIIPNGQLLIASDKNPNSPQVFYLLTPDNQLHKLSASPNVAISQQATKVQKSEDDIDRSRSQSPLQTSFIGPIINLFTYPPTPGPGRITVTNEDFFCLKEGEFLNDVIIDFYLKYLLLEQLSEKERARVHLFSSFFYRRLTSKQHNDNILHSSAQETRHARVRTWTRHVDIFSKDFIIVPINENSHWFLAVICFPGLKEKAVEQYYQEATNDPVNNAKKMGNIRIKQACILVFDSLAVNNRHNVVKALREYVQEEWRVRRQATEGLRIINRNNMPGMHPRCPLQTNHSDCGLYLLQYVESFFKNPIIDYMMPISMTATWFDRTEVDSKRIYLMKLVLKLKKILNPSLTYNPLNDPNNPLPPLQHKLANQPLSQQQPTISNKLSSQQVSILNTENKPLHHSSTCPQLTPCAFSSSFSSSSSSSSSSSFSSSSSSSSSCPNHPAFTTVNKQTIMIAFKNSNASKAFSLSPSIVLTTSASTSSVASSTPTTVQSLLVNNHITKLSSIIIKNNLDHVNVNNNSFFINTNNNRNSKKSNINSNNISSNNNTTNNNNDVNQNKNHTKIINNNNINIKNDESTSDSISQELMTLNSGEVADTNLPTTTVNNHYTVIENVASAGSSSKISNFVHTTNSISDQNGDEL